MIDRCCQQLCVATLLSCSTFFALHAVRTLLAQVCADHCRGESSSYKYYATQYGRECWCQEESINLRHAEGKCDYQCSGDESIVCGGFDSFSLYNLEEVDSPSSPTDDNYVGCFADDRNDRVLGTMTSSSSMTSEVGSSTRVSRAFCQAETAQHVLRRFSSIPMQRSNMRTVAEDSHRCSPYPQYQLPAHRQCITSTDGCTANPPIMSPALVPFSFHAPLAFSGFQSCASYCAIESPRNMYYATQWGQEVSFVHLASTAHGLSPRDFFEVLARSFPTKNKDALALVAHRIAFVLLLL